MLLCLFFVCFVFCYSMRCGRVLCAGIGQASSTGLCSACKNVVTGFSHLDGKERETWFYGVCGVFTASSHERTWVSMFLASYLEKFIIISIIRFYTDQCFICHSYRQFEETEAADGCNFNQNEFEGTSTLLDNRFTLPLFV